MKVLVTGETSYAGTQLGKRIVEINKGWDIDFISVRTNKWEKLSFSNYDAIYHVAGIVHKKEKNKNSNLYYTVNRDLTYKLALKAKKEGVQSFVFLSTMAVYGYIGKIGVDTVITKKTPAFPVSHYGKSKLEAENILESLNTKNFNISILRVPMIYGPNCPGNYKSLSKIAKKTPVFPKIENERSMIFVDQLSDVVIHIIEEKLSGLFLVKDHHDISTLEIVENISRHYGKKIFYSRILGGIIRILGNRFVITRKLFGNIVYQEDDCELLHVNYQNQSSAENIKKAEDCS